MPDYVGTVLFAGNIAYCVAALLSGWLTDAVKRPAVIAFAGLCFIAVGMYMFGPVGPPFPVQSEIMFVGVTIAFWGAGLVIVPALPYVVHCAGANNAECVSALYCACTEIGAIIGHIVSTQVSEAFSVQIAMASWALAAVLLALCSAFISIATASWTGLKAFHAE